MKAEVRRGIVLALAGLLGGFAMVVALFGTGELLKRIGAGGTSTEAPGEASAGSDKAAPLAALTPPPQEKTPGAGPDAGGPQGAARVGAEGAPTFDIVRVEPDGASVVAGRTLPSAKVELLRDGKPFADTTADASGQFALTPPDLPAGSSEIALRAVAPDGKPLPGRESVTVVVSPKRGTKPLIALSAPDAPTRVLSQPDAPETGADRPATAFAESPGKARPGEPARPPGTGTPSDWKEAARSGANKPEAGGAVRSADPAKDKPGAEAAPRIVSIDAQDGGRLDVTAQAPADSTLRLYLNDTLVASGRPGPDGRIAFAIGRGVRPGAYQVRIDSVDPAGGKVRRRAEVSFAYPESAARVASAEKPAAEAPGARRAAEGAAPPSPKAPAAAADAPKSGQNAAKPDAKPATPKVAETAAPERRNGSTGSAEPQAGAPRPEGPPAAESRRTASQTAPSAPSPARAPAAQAPAETRPAPSLAGDPATVPPPAGPAPGTVTAGTPSIAAGAGIGAPKRAADGAAAAALAPRLPESAAPPEAGRIAEAPGTVFVPEISTARITRGDSLWQISRRIYGKGNRYTVIYDANQEQIRDPDLIYPGQIFVLPKDAPAAADTPAPKRT